MQSQDFNGRKLENVHLLYFKDMYSIFRSNHTLLVCNDEREFIKISVLTIYFKFHQKGNSNKTSLLQ